MLCLESVLQSARPPRWVIVVDNASATDAVDAVRRWAAGDLPSGNTAYAELLPRSISKPYPLLVTTPAEAAAHIPAKRDDEKPQLLLLRNLVNTGYTGGNNAGLRVGLAMGADAFWILNNDTIVTPDACGALYDRLFACPRPGLAGGLLCYLSEPGTVQCRGGGYTNRYFFLSHLNGQHAPRAEALQTPAHVVEENLSFIYGASVMVSRAFLQTVGLMDERLFLYYEEQDWAWANAGRFDLGYAPEAVVYHKEGGSRQLVGLDRLSRKQLWFFARNRLLLTWKHFPLALPTVGAGMAFAAGRLLWRRLRAKNGAGRQAF